MEHTWYKCPGNHEDGGWTCQFCAGDLGLCTKCNGFEGTLPTDCPGHKMTEQLEQAVYKDELDYREDRGWHDGR